MFAFRFALGVPAPEANEPARPAHTAQIINIVSQTGGDLILQPVVKYTPRKIPKARRKASKLVFMFCIITSFFFTTSRNDCDVLQVVTPICETQKESEEEYHVRRYSPRGL